MSDLLNIFTSYELPTYNSEAIEKAAQRIADQLDATTAVKDLENFWNESLPAYFALERVHPEHLKYVEKYKSDHFFIAPKLYFTVLNRFIRDTDTLELFIPPELSFLVFMIGWQLSKGSLTVTGEAGSIGDEAYGTARIKVIGRAENLASNAYGASIFEVQGDVIGEVARNAYDNVTVKIHGNVGQYLGFGAGGSVDCVVDGDVMGSVATLAKDNATFLVTGDAALDFSSGKPNIASEASGNVMVHIKGNVGGGVGIEATDNVQITVGGNVGDYAGYGTKKNVVIVVGGNAGKNLGEKAQGNVQIKVSGNAGKKVGDKAYRNASIIVKGTGEAGIPNKSFRGILSINGNEIYPSNT